MADSISASVDDKKPEAGEKPEAALVELETRKKYFQQFIDQTEKGRKLSEQDRDYRDHKQWTAYELQKLRKRGQPPIVINRIARKVDTLIGIQQRSASDPKAYPRQPNDEELADVATDSLRYVCDKNRYAHIKAKVIDNVIVEGTGGVEVTVEQRSGGIEVIVSRKRWETIFYDPHAREEDFSDARYLGDATWMDLDAIKTLYGDKAHEIAESASAAPGMVTGSLEDRPKAMATMIDCRNKRVVVVDMYLKQQQGWFRYIFCAGGDLLPGGPSPYQDEEQKPICPIELTSLYVDRENQRYGLVRGMLGPQDEINYRRSKLLHFLSTRQTFANTMSGVDPDKAKSEMSRPDGHIEIQSGEFGKDFGVIPTTDMAAGQFELLQEAKGEIELLGPNNALRGQGSDTQSGKAWLAQQQAGMAELSMLYSTMTDLDLRVYRQIWQRCKQYWKDPMYIRVTDDANAPKFLQVNVPIMDPMTNQPMIDPRTGQPAMKHEIGKMDVDIIVDSAPDAINAAEDQFNMLVKLRELGEPIPATAIIQASNIKNKKQILDAIEQQQAKQEQAMAAALQAKNAPPPPAPVSPIEVAKLHLADTKLQQGDKKLAIDASKTAADNNLKATAAHKNMAEARRIETERKVGAVMDIHSMLLPGQDALAH